MISSLNIFLLLESRFGIRSMLTGAQRRSSIDTEGGYSGKFMIDEGVIERNRLLVKCSVLGGPSERQLPPQCLCEVRILIKLVVCPKFLNLNNTYK